MPKDAYEWTKEVSTEEFFVLCIWKK
jgi:hypothetical protein